MSPSQLFGAADGSEQPQPGSAPWGRTWWGQPTLERGEKEQKQDPHPGWLSALAGPPRGKQGLEGAKEGAT